jgi:putrescine transport system substrate-binding protein
MWGTVGLGYNVNKVQEVLGVDRLDSWSFLLDPEKLKKLTDCGVYMLDSPTEILPSTLKYLGLDPESTSPDDFAKAEAALVAIRPYLRKFDSAEFINALADGDICMTPGWSGDVLKARSRAAEAANGVKIAYTIPKEGTVMWFDQLAIPADAKHVNEAHALINFLMKPEIAARNTNYLFFPNGNKASQQFVSKEILSDPAIYPDEETLQNLFAVLPYDPQTQRLVTRTWTKITTGN